MRKIYPALSILALLAPSCSITALIPGAPTILHPRIPANRGEFAYVYHLLISPVPSTILISSSDSPYNS